MALLLLLAGLDSSNAWAQSSLVSPTELVGFEGRWWLRAGKVDDSVATLSGEPLTDAGWRAVEAPLRGAYELGKKDRKSSSVIDLEAYEPLPGTAELASDAQWLARDFELAEGTSMQSLTIELRFSGPVVVYLNGSELLRHGVGGDERYVETRPESLLGNYVTDADRDARRRVLRGLDPTALRTGSNRLLLRLQRARDTSPPLFFDLRLLGYAELGLVNGPYLQDLRSDRVTVLFESTNLSAPYVDFGTGSSLDQSATVPSTGGVLHELVLTGLSPATRYYYRARAETVWPVPSLGSAASARSAVYSFVTAPDDDESPFVFIAYGDNRGQPAVHGALTERMLAEKAAFVINTGDLTTSGYDLDLWEREFFAPARPLMPSLALWPLIGNHELDHLNYFELFALPETEAWYSFRWGMVDFFALDSDTDIGPGSAQLAWFEGALVASKAHWKVVLLHHPAFSCMAQRLPGFEPVRSNVLPLLAREGVALVLAGHDHLYGHAEYEGVHHVITGGGGAWTYDVTLEAPMQRCEEVHHFVVVEVTRERLLLRALDIDGGEVDVFEIRR